MVNYDLSSKEDAAKLLAKQKGRMSVVVDFSKWPEGAEKPEIWSDHHVNEAVGEEKQRRKELAGTKREQSKYSKSGAAIGQTQYRSEAEHLATVHAQNLADPTTIKAISDVDSATFNNLEDAVNFPTKYREAGRMSRLANITNMILSQLIKANPKAIDKLVREAKPSLVSVYNKTMEMVKLTDQQKEAIEEIAKEKPDWKKIDALRSKLPKNMAIDVAAGKKVESVPSIEKTREGAAEDVIKHTSPGSKFTANGVVVIQNAVGRGQPSRYLGSLLTKQDNTRYPALMREWPLMVQIALNPDLDVTSKEKVDLTKIVKDAMQEVKNEVGRKWSDWSFNIVMKESGGHKGIATVSALGTIVFLPKLEKQEFQELEDLDRRLKDLKNTKTSLKVVAPAKYERLKELENKKKKLGEQRNEIKNAIKERILQKVNEALKGVSVKPTENPERFKFKKSSSVKEDIQYRVRNFI